MREICLKFSVIFDLDMEKTTEDIKWELKVLLRNVHQEKRSRIWLELMHWMKLALGLYKFLVLSHFKNWVWHPWFASVFTLFIHTENTFVLWTERAAGVVLHLSRAELSSSSLWVSVELPSLDSASIRFIIISNMSLIFLSTPRDSWPPSTGNKKGQKIS